MFNEKGNPVWLPFLEHEYNVTEMITFPFCRNFIGKKPNRTSYSYLSALCVTLGIK